MKQSTEDNNVLFSTSGFRYFNDNMCGYGTCTSTDPHYHCLACGYATNELHQISNHRNNCPAPNFSQTGNYGRNLESTTFHSSTTQSQECSYYSMYGLTQTTGPPMMSPGTGSFYRTQPAVFSPYYSANSLGYDNYAQSSETWSSMSRPSSLGSREVDRLTSCKETRNSKVPLPASSSCLYSQSYTTDLYDPGLDSFLTRNMQQSSSSRGNMGSNTSAGSSQKQLPSFEPSLGFMIGPEDGMYSPAPFSFHVGSESFTEHKASPFNGVVEDLPGESCLGLPFPPAPPQQPPSCLLDPSPGDQDSDLGSDEHEIIVEETGDDQLSESKRSCVVCAGRCGWAAVELQVDRPVTLSTHVPVWAKLAELLGMRIQSRLEPGQTLCSACLQLLHTIDQLQSQLADATQRFLNRLQDTPHNSVLCEKEQPSLTLSKEDDIVTEELPCPQLLENDLEIALAPDNLKNRETESIDLLATHDIEQNEHKKQPANFECEPCGRSFHCRRSLTSHMRRHVRKMNSQISRFICEVCGRQFSSKSNLSAHKPICSGEFPLQCRTCGKGFALQTKLSVHEATHQGHFPFSCDICHKGFIKQSDLSVHKRAHTGEKPYVCEICGKTFSNSGNYNHHSKLHTIKEKPFTCSICNKGFMRRSYLSAHMNRHSGSKPFTCDICNKAFPDRSNLHHHRRLHEGFKPYTCPICGKALSSGLQAHLRTHSGERPFACNICGQRFTANSSLSKHMKRHKEKQAT